MATAVSRALFLQRFCWAAGYPAGGLWIRYTDCPPLSRRQPNMKVTRISKFLLLVIGVPVLTACARNPSLDYDRTVSMRCPAGSTMTCEAEQIGRMRHGSFPKSNEKCGCVPDSSRGMQSPSIPGIH